MSTSEHRTRHCTYSRSQNRRQKSGLNVDLNVVPPGDNRDHVGPSTRSRSQDYETDEGVASIPPAPIDLEAFDDDVVISSPRAFAEACVSIFPLYTVSLLFSPSCMHLLLRASFLPLFYHSGIKSIMIKKNFCFSQAKRKNNSRRNHGLPSVVDVDSVDRLSRVSQTGHNKRRRISSGQTVINYDIYINLEAANNSARVDATRVLSQPVIASPPPPPKDPTFNCPICMGPLVEEMSTKCGHIFCKACIKAAIAAQKKCPTCRRKVTTKDIIRVYLPAAR